MKIRISTLYHAIAGLAVIFVATTVCHAQLLPQQQQFPALVEQQRLQHDTSVIAKPPITLQQTWNEILARIDNNADTISQQVRLAQKQYPELASAFNLLSA